MGVRKRHPFSAVHITMLAGLVDKEIDSITTTTKDPLNRRQQLAGWFRLQDIIGEMTDSGVAVGQPSDPAPDPNQKPATTKATSNKPRKKGKTKAQKDAEKAVAAAGQAGTGETTTPQP